MGPFRILTLLPEIYDGSFDSALVVQERGRNYFLNNDCLLPHEALKGLHEAFGPFAGAFLGYGEFLPSPTCYRAGTNPEIVHPQIQSLYLQRSIAARNRFAEIVETLRPEWVAPYASGIRFLNEDLQIHNRTFEDARLISKTPICRAQVYLIQPGDFIRDEVWGNNAGDFQWKIPQDRLLPPLFSNNVSATETSEHRGRYDRYFFDLISGEIKRWREPMKIEIIVEGGGTSAKLCYLFDGSSLERSSGEADISIAYPASLVNDVLDGRVGFSALHQTYRFNADVRRFAPVQMSVHRWRLSK